MIVNVVTVRVGTKYDAEYSLRLHDMVGRNLSTVDQRHWEITDDPGGCAEGVTPIPAPEWLAGWWVKPYLFSRDMPWANGDRIAYFDLDTVITGRLEDLAETKGIMQDPHWPMFNSSVMVWDHGEHRDVWDKLTPEAMTAPGPLPALYPKGQSNGGDQEHVTACAPDWPTFPAAWCRSYADAKLWPPEGCKVVVFHGSNKPDNQPADSWVHDVWKVGGFTSLPEIQGMNVTHAAALANVRENIKLDVEWFTGAPETCKTMVLVCGGPSMKDHIRQIKDHKQRGAIIVTVNNALKYLLSVGIKPDRHVILDARPDNIAFLKDAPEGIRYLLASQCDPSLFELMLKEQGRHQVILWHNGLGDGEEITELCEGIDKPCVIVPGGCTVGLRSLWLGFGSGFRKIHVYGMDSSYAGDQHHAYPQALNDADTTIEVVLGGKRYLCAKWMARQANDFQKAYPQLTEMGVKLWVHGTGLIPDLYAAMRKQQEAA